MAAQSSSKSGNGDRTATATAAKFGAYAVTVETEQLMFQLYSQYGGTLSRIAIQRAEPVGKFLGWKALAPVTQWSVVKT